jgi:hypothetical protein
MKGLARQGLGGLRRHFATWEVKYLRDAFPFQLAITNFPSAATSMMRTFKDRLPPHGGVACFARQRRKRCRPA